MRMRWLAIVAVLGLFSTLGRFVQAKEECSHDIAFVIDCSASVRDANFDEDNWDYYILRFLLVIIENLNIGPTATHVGVVTFGNEGQLIFNLNNFTDFARLKEAIRGIPYCGGRSNITGGLRVMRTQVFDAAAGDRPDVQNVAIVITDGFDARENDGLAAEVRLARSANIRIVGIGVTSQVNQPLLKSVVTYPDQDYFFVPDFDRLTSILSGLIRQSCRTPTPATPIIPATTQRPAPAASTCTSWGDPHYVTFDRKSFDYQGVCKHILAAPCQPDSALPFFQVFGDNEHRYGVTRVSYPRYVEVVYNGTTVRLVKGDPSKSGIQVYALVNGQTVSVPYNESEYRIFYSGSKAYYTSSFGLSVTYDGIYTATVTVPPTYAGKMCGLCGNYDGNANNDITLANGTFVGNLPNGPNLFGDSYVVDDSEQSNDRKCIAPDPPPTCDPVPESYKTGCGYINDVQGVMSECISRLSREQANIQYESCVLDACFSDGRSICNSINVIVQQCRAAGVRIPCDFWQSIRGCENITLSGLCPRGMVYKCAVSACQPTCSDPRAPDRCTLPDVDSCVCPDRQLLHNGVCVSQCPLGCYDSRQQFRLVGSSWQGAGCTTESCVRCTSCTGGVRIDVKNTCAGSGQVCSSDGRCISGQTACVINGDPHYRTFDVQSFSYQGVCKYNLASTCHNDPTLPQFQVLSKNEHRQGSTSVSYPKYIEIVHNGTTVRLLKIASSGIPVSALVNGLPVHIPFTGTGFRLLYSGALVSYVSDFGLSVVFDGTLRVTVSVSVRFKGKMCGYCGNNDGNPNNDLTLPNGTFVGRMQNGANIFGDSHVVDDDEEPNRRNCHAPPPPANCDPIPESYTARCGYINDVQGILSQCISRLSRDLANRYYENCVLDACFSGGRGICSSINVFLAECHASGVQLPCDIWQSIQGCENSTTSGLCPRGMVYKCAVSACQPTCSDPRAPDRCTLPDVNSCVCPDGQLLHNGVCVSQCPLGCFDSRQQFKLVGSSWQAAGCTTESCVRCNDCTDGVKIIVKNSCIAGQVCSSDGRCVSGQTTCLINGDPHYRTFDVQSFSYQGVCKYNLASTCHDDPTLPQFQVLSKNEHRQGSTSVSYPKYVEIVYNGTTVRLVKIARSGIPISAVINGVPVSIPYTGTDFRVFYSGANVHYVLDFGLSVVFDGVLRVFVSVPLQFKGKMCGYCGNNDGDPNNDLTLPNGTFVGRMQNGANVFGDSYVVRDMEQVADQNCDAPPPPPICDPIPESYTARCGYITDMQGVLSQCISRLSTALAQNYYNNCILDACFTNGQSICSSISVLIRECHESGVRLPCDIWQSVQGCENATLSGLCPSGMVYKCAVSACQPTCSDPRAPDRCTLPDVDSCVCPDGQLLHNGVCVSQCPLGCYDSRQQFHEVGTSWSGSNCTSSSCVRCADCTDGVRISVSSSCVSGQICNSAGRCVSGQTVCLINGDPHYRTFDVQSFSYQGVCKYNLASTCHDDPTLPQFQVLSKNEHRHGSTSVSYPKYIEIVYNGTTVRLGKIPSTGIPVGALVNGQSVQIPYTTSDFRIFYNGAHVNYVSAFGLSVLFDGSLRVTVSVPLMFLGKMCGYCGNNDGNPNNDFTLPDGTFVGGRPNAIDAFGESYAVHDPEEPNGKCHPQPPPPVCSPIPESYKTRCGYIKDMQGVLSRCVTQLPRTLVNTYYDNCILDACYSGGRSICSSIYMFASECSTAGLQLPCTIWQSIMGCEESSKSGLCPSGMIYQCWVSACQPTCSDPNATATCRLPNVDGCVCPEGQMLHNGSCRPSSQCPVGCIDQQQQLRQIGETWQGPGCTTLTCVQCSSCSLGAQITSAYKCSPTDTCTANGQCQPRISVCSSSGDPHYTTFDFLKFDYQGICKYSLAAPCTAEQNMPYFQVFSRNEHRYGSVHVSYTSYVEIAFNGTTVRIAKDSVLVNGKVVQIPYTVDDFRVFYNGNSVRYTSSFGLTVDFDQKWTVSVSVPATYAGKMCGLCGNYDGNPRNDLTLANGTSVGHLPTAANLVGDSYVVSDPENPNAVCPAPAPRPPCDGRPIPKEYTDGCAVIVDPNGVLSPCIARLPVAAAKAFYDDCIMDACYTKGQSIYNSIKVFIDECRRSGVDLNCNIWSIITGSENRTSTVLCSPGMVFRCGVSACQPTCADPQAPATCRQPDVDTCVCPPGQLLYNGACTAQCPTGCYDRSQQPRQVGETWTGPGCTTVTCVRCNNCKFGSQNEVSSKCSANEVCGEDEQCVKGPSVCEYSGDPHYKTFDGKRFDYQGTCKLKLAEVCDRQQRLPFFSVFARNEHRHRSKSVSYAWYVEIVYNNTVVRLTRRTESQQVGIPVTVLVDGKRVQVPFAGTNYLVFYSGTVTRYVSPGLNVTYDGIWTVSVAVSVQYEGKMCGLCGNNDGNPNNDLITADGTDVGQKPHAANLVGDSFVVNDPENEKADCKAPTPDPHDCDQVARSGETVCSYLNDANGVLARCISRLSPAVASSYYKDCMMDACYTDGQSMCRTVKVFIEECARSGVHLPCDVWESIADCGGNTTTSGLCPDGMIYRCSVPACQPTCCYPEAAENCPLPPIDSCVCPRGQLLHNGVCTSTCPGGCFDRQQQLRPIGHSWLGSNCTRVTCISCPNCPRGAETKLTGCLPDEVCGPNGECLKEVVSTGSRSIRDYLLTSLPVAIVLTFVC